MALFACIFVANFPLEALLRAEPELRPQPVAVLEGKVPLQKVLACNEKARRVGVEPGMTKPQVEACAGLALRARSPLQETAAHAALLDCAQSFSPRVEDAGCGAVMLDLAGLESLFGSLSKIAHGVARRAADLGLEVSVAVASNPDTAVLAACGFTGVTVIPAGKEAGRLGSLPLEVLFAESSDHDGAQILETFRRWGIRCLRDLAALPDVALSERLGQEGLHLQQLARGATSRTLVPLEPASIFEEAAELEHPLVLLEPLAFLLNQMLEQICSRLAARALATQELRLQLELADGHLEDGDYASASGMPGGRGRPPHTNLFCRTLRLPVPLLEAKVFLKLLQLDLKANPPGAPIVKIHLAAEAARPRAAQGGLFLPPAPEPERLELTLARIAGIVGHDKLGVVELLDTHRPEGFRVQHFAPDKPQGHASPPAQNKNDSAVTALRIFRPPVRATVTLRHGKPFRVACSKRKQVQEGEVLWAAGPWRTSGDWWEKEGWARDEWDIALQGESGVMLYRLVRDRLNGQWLVEGSYD
jgi:protein ImuB